MHWALLQVVLHMPGPPAAAWGSRRRQRCCYLAQKAAARAAPGRQLASAVCQVVRQLQQASSRRSMATVQCPHVSLLHWLGQPSDVEGMGCWRLAVLRGCGLGRACASLLEGAGSRATGLEGRMELGAPEPADEPVPTGVQELRR